MSEDGGSTRRRRYDETLELTQAGEDRLNNVNQPKNQRPMKHVYYWHFRGGRFAAEIYASLEDVAKHQRMVRLTTTSGDAEHPRPARAVRNYTRLPRGTRDKMWSDVIETVKPAGLRSTYDDYSSSLG